jgi:hypothetical protein
MSDVNATYPPLDVLKPVAEGVWIVDSGPMRVLGMPLPVRMTVIRLAGGDMLLHSPTRFDPNLRREIERQGRIHHLVAPNVAHWSFLAAWQQHCPEATNWAAPQLRRRAQVRRSGVRLDRDLGDAPPEAWAGEIDQITVPGGGGFREVAFFHRPTRTLVLTDLVQNLEAAKLPRLVRPLARLARVLAPGGRAPVYLRLVVRLKRRAASEAARRLVELAPERVIFAHGSWFDRDAQAALRRSLAWLLE